MSQRLIVVHLSGIGFHNWWVHYQKCKVNKHTYINALAASVHLYALTYMQYQKTFKNSSIPTCLLHVIHPPSASESSWTYDLIWFDLMNMQHHDKQCQSQSPPIVIGATPYIINLLHLLQTTTHYKCLLLIHFTVSHQTFTVNCRHSPAKLQWKPSRDLRVQFNTTRNFRVKVRHSRLHNLANKRENN